MIKIRKARHEDSEALYSFDYLAKENKENRREFIINSIKKQICYVAEINDNVVGYIVLDYNFYFHGMINMLYVHPNFRHMEVGTVLIKHVESICKTEKLFTSTNQSNLPMQGLMNKMKFVPSGCIYNLDKEDPEIIYFKRLKQNR